MKSKKKVILVGEEHADTSHIWEIGEYVISELKNNQRVAFALEQNCGSKTMEDLSNVLIPGARARSSVIRNHSNFQSDNDKDLLQKISKQGALDDETKKIYIERFISIDQEIAKNVDTFCSDMQFQDNKNKSDYINTMKKVAQFAYADKKNLQFVSVDTKDLKPKKSLERDIDMFKNISNIDADIVIYPVGSGHIYNNGDANQRLAALLIQNSDIDLELANLYTANKSAYKTVEDDIQDFIKLLETKNTVLHYTKQSIFEETFQAEEIKLNDNIAPKKPIFKVYKDTEFKGFDSTNDPGLSLKDIEYNLKQISDLYQGINQNNSTLSKNLGSYHIVASELNQWLLLTSNIDGQITHLSIIEITDNNKHHACIIQAIYSNNKLHLNIIDPLSKEDSLFGPQLDEVRSFLENTLSQNGYTVECNITYKGLQDAQYATCGDMCLIMTQELMSHRWNKADFDHANSQTDILGNYHDS